MVYYAYAKNSNDDWSWRYVIVAPSLHTLNQWYNAVQDKVADNVLQRVDDDFYVFDRNKLNLGRSTADGHEAPRFMNKIIFQLLSDNEGRNLTSFVNATIH
ncbi:uncharacterized protein N7498_010032 [Penicillium cinerascens]|uniref:PH domain-containing protein n=1 Tax=Penicillium cinerascens TaxID=70096 RepID=A0A9W9M8J4_9EURO|nr:uncharacterized protein N7498_010032 [Penicillium cinerascens]KAJ5191047.1 hypothetical protein N7498_010032 [Penicillium cinerascens]